MKNYENTANGFNTLPLGNNAKFRRGNLARKIGLFLGITLLSPGTLALNSPKSDSDSIANTPVELTATETPKPSPTTLAPELPRQIRYADGVAQWSYLIELWSAEHGVDPCLTGALIERESGGDPNAHLIHTDGLMQIDGNINASTAQEYDLNYTDLYDPSNNIALGTALIAEAQEATGIDTIQDLTQWQVHEISVYYHGEGFYYDLKNGSELPANVTEASTRLQQNYAEFC